jgi:hypothetical protein
MKKRTWKWIGVLIGVPALTGGALAAYAWHSSGAIFERHERDVAKIIEELRQKDRSQPALFGTGIEGNGWDSLSLGLAGLEKTPFFDEEGWIKGDCEEEKPQTGPLQVAELDKIFDSHLSDVANLREAFARTRFDSHPRYEDGVQIPPPRGLQSVHVSGYLAAWARRLHAQGRDREALEVLILDLAVVQGLARQESLFCHRSMGFGESLALEALRTLLEGHALTAGDLRVGCQRLDTHQRERPSITEGLLVESVLTRRTYLDLRAGPIPEQPFLEVKDDQGLLSWRYFFSRRLMIASALDLWNGFARRYLDLDPLPVHQRAAAAKVIAGEVIELRNPMLWKLNPVYDELYQEDARALSRLSLARVALALAEYEAGTGHAPGDLSDLVPVQLSSVPLDPQTGSAFTYHQGKLGPAQEAVSVVVRKEKVLPDWTVRKKLP